MIPEKLRMLRKSRGMTLEALADAVGTSKQTIQRYESGRITNIPPDKVVALASALSTTPSELMGWGRGEEKEGAEGMSATRSRTVPAYKNLLPIVSKRLPILGEIACGEPIYAEEEHESYVTADGDLDADFCLRAHGDSMTGARIMDGDIVFIRSQDAVDNGEIAAVIIDDEATLKRVYYYPDEGKLILSPENPRYAPLVYMKEELDNVRIIGKAVAFQSHIL